MTIKRDFDLQKIKSLIKDPHISVHGIRHHEKASESYVDVTFSYPEDESSWEGSLPFEYRRTGISMQTEEDICQLIQSIYNFMRPLGHVTWHGAQKEFWDSKRKEVTWEFFESLKDFKWKCINCDLPKNPNWARRVQDLKEFGYTISTNTNSYCKKCGKNTTHLILLPLKRGPLTGYETISPELKKRIIKVLKNVDVYENRLFHSLIPDHKFPEIRWDDKTKEENKKSMTDDEIKSKFQLLSNQRNQQKREICRKCYQTGERGKVYGIKFYYAGCEKWDPKIPKIGKNAEAGCIGCPWYDLQQWRTELNKATKKVRSQ